MMLNISMPEGHDMNPGDILMLSTVVDIKRFRSRKRPYRVISSGRVSVTVKKLSPLGTLVFFIWQWFSAQDEVSI